jgi:hypothetical protein
MGGVGHHFIADVVNQEAGVADGNIWFDQLRKRLGDFAIDHFDGGDFQQLLGSVIQPGGFRVQNNKGLIGTNGIQLRHGESPLQKRCLRFFKTPSLYTTLWPDVSFKQGFFLYSQ